MKSFEVYRNIRREALIMNLPLNLFSMQMVAVIGSLLMIIFSFSLLLIILLFLGNIGLYICFLRFQHFKPFLLAERRVLGLITNRKIGLAHEKN